MKVYSMEIYNVSGEIIYDGETVLTKKIVVK